MEILVLISHFFHVRRRGGQVLIIPDDMGLAHAVRGAPGGAPVVLLHDAGLAASAWARVAGALDARARIVLPDLRGHGASPDSHDDHSMRDVVEDVVKLLRSLNIRDALLVGEGIGGMIAQAVAAEAPATTRALVLIGTAPKIGTEDRWLRRADDLAALDAEARAEAILSRATIAPPAPEIRALAAAVPGETMRRICVAVAHTDLRASTDTLRLPVLGLVGREDRVTPPDLMREMIEGIPGADLVLLPRCGHLASLDAPEAVASAINGFMARTGHLLAPIGNGSDA